ncbi:aldehyde dehydrogenase family protein [Halobacteriovorax sp. GFR7]|uniref:aldehyde dehydrogenase family protein n=1 Tax=unclassified Halobacteriovorax TaxID=2639665 RepID=UPI003D983660
MQNFSQFRSSFVDDEFLYGESSIEVLNKYDQSILNEVDLLASYQYEKVIQSSLNAFEEFQNFDSAQRSKLLLKLADFLEEEAAFFSHLICLEAGKPISYAKGEIARCVETIRLAGEKARHHSSETPDLSYGPGADKMAMVRHEPEGIVFGISPFNFPLNLALHKIAPALAVGCSIIVKPSPQTPITLLAFAKLLSRVGFPKGVVNIVICEDELAQRFLEDERINIFSFTGSAKVGWALKALSGKKKCLLELGGNAAVIVNDVEDMEAVTSQIVTGSFLYSGQICISTQRVFIASDIFDEFVEQFLEQVETIGSGDPKDESVINGPVINEGALERIHQWVQEAISNGAELLCGGHIIDEDHHIYAPTVLTNTDLDMKVVSEEIFGPVVILEPYDSFSEAIELVNDSKYGLQAGVFTNSLVNMKEASQRIDVGGIIFNNVPGFRMDAMPYGGIKDSGLGREGIAYAMEDYTRKKLILF